MQAVRDAAQEAAEDIFFGQAVVIWARWFVIAAVTVMMLWSSADMSELTLAILLTVPLIAVNFFVHGRYLMEKPINRLLLMALSAVDLVVITLIMALWQRSDWSPHAPFVVLYYPVVLAFAFVFPGKVSIPYTLASMVAYGVGTILVNSDIFDHSIELEKLVTQLITLGATGALGAYYWRIQRARRRQAAALEPAAR